MKGFWGHAHETHAVRSNRKKEGGSHEDNETKQLSYVAGGMFSDVGDECCNGGYHWKVSSFEASTTVAEFFPAVADHREGFLQTAPAESE